MKTPLEIGNELDAWLLKHKLTETMLVQALAAKSPPIRVSQSWISRLRCGRFVRISRKTAAVLDYANIRSQVGRSARDAEGLKLIEEALDEAWDGSLGSARTLAGVLRGVGQLRRDLRR